MFIWLNARAPTKNKQEEETKEKNRFKISLISTAEFFL